MSEPDEEIPSLEPKPATYIVTVDEDGLMAMLSKLRSSEENIADLAAKLEVSAQYLGLVLAGKKPGGAKLWKGLHVVRTYRVFEVEIVIDEQ